MESNEIDFWTLVEYDNASKRMKDALDNVSSLLRLSAKHIASVILKLGADGVPGFQFSDGTTNDLKKVAASCDLYSTEFCMDVLTACLSDTGERSPDFLNAVRADCPCSYEYYILACKLLS